MEVGGRQPLGYLLVLAVRRKLLPACGPQEAAAFGHDASPTSAARYFRGDRGGESPARMPGNPADAMDAKAGPRVRQEAGTKGRSTEALRPRRTRTRGGPGPHSASQGEQGCETRGRMPRRYKGAATSGGRVLPAAEDG